MDDLETEHLFRVSSSHKAKLNDTSKNDGHEFNATEDRMEILNNMLHINEDNDSSNICLNDSNLDSTICSETMLNVNLTPVEDISLFSSPAVSLTEIQTDFNEDIYCAEKTGATPENVKKIDDVTLVSQAQNNINKRSYVNQQLENNTNDVYTQTAMNNSSTATPAEIECISELALENDDGFELTSKNGNELKIVEDESSAKQCRAFTVYFGDDSLNESASASATAKYKNMVERFQNRHRRGASMSKLECGDTANKSINNSHQMSQTVTRNFKAPTSHTINSTTIRSTNDSDTTRVKMRPRDRSATGIRDANKRHSWSPRSSTHETNCNIVQDNKKNMIQKNFQSVNHSQTIGINSNSTVPQKLTKCRLKSIEKTPEKNQRNQVMGKESLYINEEVTNSSVPKRTDQFTPKSTAMQMALDVDLFCPQPPLADKSNFNLDDDNVSETATYTLDGDNYTEEQKELMNIDRASSGSETSIHEITPSRPTNLPINSISKTNITSTFDNEKRSNVLEVNYYHDTPNFRPKTSYLEKLKIQMRGITKSVKKHNASLLSDSSPEDLGTFTSITTSGVLSKKTSLDLHPKLGRKDSLSKSLIDSSEFISAQRLGNPQRPYSGGYTDRQKAEDSFNAFRNQTDSQILNAIELPQNLEYQTESDCISDATELKTAKSKNDWIQAWARNARARSVSSAIKDNNAIKQNSTSQHLQCESGEDDMSVLTDDGLMYRNKQFEQLRIGDFDYLSDPNVSQIVLSPRPPKSPTKIPSPLHSIGRARTSRNRGSLQNILQCENDDDRDTDVYLLNTAIAISNFTKNLSRKNSFKSPPSSINSPKGKVSHQFHSGDEQSPQHQRTSTGMEKYQSNNFHKRNLSLDYRTSPNAENMMTHSFNEQQLNDLKYARQRKNSYDSQMHTVSPIRHDMSKTTRRNNYTNIDQTRESIKQNKNESKPPLGQHATQLSPIRRSSSFSIKKNPEMINAFNQRTQSGQRSKLNVNKNVFTPPSVRHNKYNQQNTNSKTLLQKSSSSNCFKNMYSDYDDNITYYINDEDDLVDDYFPHEDDYTGKMIENTSYDQTRQIEANNTNPAMSMARYNKALLMRIERSKQKVAGISNSNGMKPAPGGVIACPNTPELPRRAVQSASRSSMRKSVPRDSSLNRLRGEIPNSLASAKKQIIQTAKTVDTYPNVKASTGGDKKVQTKYLDISKYKPVHGANFLRKNEAKITLKNDIKRSPVNVASRTDTGSISTKSAKPLTTNLNNDKRESNVAIQKEMWKRRATYDPMKAAAEDRRRKEEEKRQALGNSYESSSVARSQSFHYGVGNLSQTNF